MIKKLKAPFVLFLVVLMVSSSILTSVAKTASEIDTFMPYRWDNTEYNEWAQEYYGEEFKPVYDTKDATPVNLVFPSIEEFEKWISRFDKEVQDAARSQVDFVKGSDLPKYITASYNDPNGELKDNFVEQRQIDSEKVYVVTRSTWWEKFCKVCMAVVLHITLYTFDRYVLNTAFDILEIKWDEYAKCVNNHTSYEGYQWEDTHCPHINWCGGTWQAVVSDNGSYVECECECGTLWNSYSP